MEAKDFNNYLATDGVPDVLAARRRSGELDRPAHERYQKHVKAVIQVGTRRSGDFDGIAVVRLRSPGVWYVKFIYMTPAVGDTTIDYESKWATLTFQVR